jgi:flagellar biosynthetic protein FliQ
VQESDIIAILTATMWTVAMVAAPPLLAALGVGLVMSLLQAVTQINEQTLAFVPKVIGVGLALLLAGAFMAGTLEAFTQSVFDRLVAVGGR